ncbi:MAG TPA: hypothetical protein VFU47_12000, partial [Armatimonadota bacterium]|nr:hypothetical protein [Armatimonadota bacterium]
MSSLPASSPLPRVCGILIPVAVLVTGVTVGAQTGRDDSVLPSAPAAQPAPAPPAAPQPAVAPRLEIQVLRAGPAPYAWLVPGRVVKSFITDGPETLTLVAQARVKERPDLGEQIRWSVEPPAGFELEPGSELAGPKLVARLRRPGGNPSGEGEALSLSVAASVT